MEQLSEVKGNRGLGFRDLQSFNKAMLAKQLQRVLTNPSLLVSRVLKSKYLKGESVWKMIEKAGDSWMLMSILSAKDLLEEDVRKRVGDRSTIDIWKDKWLMNSETGKVRSTKLEGCQISKVQELICNGK